MNDIPWVTSERLPYFPILYGDARNWVAFNEYTQKVIRSANLSTDKSSRPLCFVRILRRTKAVVVAHKPIMCFGLSIVAPVTRIFTHGNIEDAAFIAKSHIRWRTSRP